MEFPNNPICSQFEDFISSTIIDRFKTGSLIFWGEVGEVQPPHLVMPITVEPTKPRMCHDERFLNLWIKDCPFSLHYLSDLPRYVGPGHFQTVCDDKSGYDHIWGPPIGFSGSGIWLISGPGFGILTEKEDEIRDCNFDRDTGLDDFNRRESGNVALTKPRFGNSRDWNMQRKSSFQLSSSY